MDSLRTLNIRNLKETHNKTHNIHHKILRTVETRKKTLKAIKHEGKLTFKGPKSEVV